MLKAISRETFDLPAVLDTLIASACRLCDADIGTIRYEDGPGYGLAATYGCRPEWHKHFASYSTKPNRASVFGQTILKGSTVHIPDVLEDPDYARPEAQKLMNLRAALGVPLVRDGRVFGVVNLFRTTPRPFTQKQIELAETFADQAVIAIENVRLFEAEQQRTAELTRIAGAADRHRRRAQGHQPLDLRFAVRSQYADRVGDETVPGRAEASFSCATATSIRLRASCGYSAEAVAYSVDRPMLANRDSATGRAALEGRAGPRPRRAGRSRITAPPGTSEAFGYRTVVSVPLLREGTTIGVFSLIRDEVEPFTDKQIELIKTFADQAVIAIENVRLFEAEQQRSAELPESLDQHTATAEILKVIASSPTDVQPVFDAIAQSAMRLFAGQSATVTRVAGDEIHLAALTAGSEEGIAAVRSSFPSALSSSGIHSRVARSAKPAFRFDIETEPESRPRSGNWRAPAAIAASSSCPCCATARPSAPSALPGASPGRSPTSRSICCETFADQAVIAIENVRLFDDVQRRSAELAESLAQQTATSEVLQVISSSPGELEPVFEAMLENATRICEAKFGNLFLFEGNCFRAVAVHGVSNYADWTRREPVVDIGEIEHFDTPLFRVSRDKALIHIHDLRLEESYVSGNPRMKSLVETAGALTHLVVPMLKDDELVGAIVMYRQEVRPFSDKQIALVQNFAAQAVIAIENTRLLSELRETLERQTATSEVLQVISSSPGELKPVFDTMLAKATELCDASYGTMWLRDGDVIRLVAYHGVLPESFTDVWQIGSAIPDDADAPIARTIRSGEPVYVEDLREDQGYREGNPIQMAAADLAGIRTLVAVPMLKENGNVGGITIYRREVRPFTDKQVALVSNFAAQAVIAIENARLLSELRESLEQQTATSEVLKVISSSSGELQPVFETLLENATRLCGAKFGNLYLAEGDAFRTTAMHNVPPAFAEARRREPLVRPTPGGALGRLASSKKVEHLTDVAAEQGYIDRDPMFVTAVELGGFRALLGVPMLRDGELVGAIIIYRQEVGAFTDKQIELVQNFAAQAVIAIENARLLNELRESLEQQTATSEVLKVIASSTGELAPVFDAMLANAAAPLRSALWRALAARGRRFPYGGVARRPAAALSRPVAQRDIVPPWRGRADGARRGVGSAGAGRRTCGIRKPIAAAISLRSAASTTPASVR